MPDDKNKVQYHALTAEDRLLVARDFLRARESDAYRAYLSRLATPGAQPHTEDEEQALQALRKEVESLEKEVNRERSA